MTDRLPRLTPLLPITMEEAHLIHLLFPDWYSGHGWADGEFWDMNGDKMVFAEDDATLERQLCEDLTDVRGFLAAYPTSIQAVGYRAMQHTHNNPFAEDDLTRALFAVHQAQAEKARLIAAAPDLLEALRDIVDCVAQTTNEDGSYGIEICQADDFSEARAAIAKATGADT